MVNTGGSLLKPAIALILSCVSTGLQYASMSVEKRISLDENQKKKVQNFISITQCIIFFINIFNTISSDVPVIGQVM